MNEQYEIGDYRFDPAAFLPADLFQAITDVRVKNPEIIAAEADRRRRRTNLTIDGRLVIVATDHPGRRVTAIRNEPLAMGNRFTYLSRALRVLTSPGCDGVMGTPDFMEDLLIINHLAQEAGGPPLLDEKVLIGCMNRGGHAGVAGEIDDRFTCFSARQLKRLHFEGGKMMYRLDVEDERSIQAINDCALAITELSREGLHAFVEPMNVRRTVDGGQETVKTVEALAKDAGAASALGESSARTWLKLSYTDGYEQVARATCLPILMLGGPAKEDPTSTLRDFHAGMQAGSNVRGVMVGRNITFVQEDDPRAVAAAIGAIVHDGCSVQEASARLADERGKQMDLLRGWRRKGQ